MKISYRWLQSYITQLPDENKLSDIFTFHITEVDGVEKLANGDTIFDLKILPDRAHDLLSHQGVARELCGLLGVEFKDPSISYKIPTTQNTNLKVQIENKNSRRYTARIVRGVKVEPSPKWMVDYLEGIGQRSINNIVDATNIVMYDIGQPVHAFDMSKTGSEIIICNAKNDTEFKLVGREGIVVKLKDTDMIIEDKDRNPLAIAGVKGGFESGVSDTTTDIILEVANFDPTSVRKSAKRLGIFTDSLKRFENDISPELCDIAMVQLSALIYEMCPSALFEDIVDVYPTCDEYKKKKTITFTTDFINKKLGAKITDEDVENILKNYKYEYTKTSSGTNNSSGPRISSPEDVLSDMEGRADHSELIVPDSVFIVTVPTLRFDLENPIDMVDEIGRVYGYAKIAGTLPILDFKKFENNTYAQIQNIYKKMLDDGYREVMTYTFTDKGEVEILSSPSDKKFLRTNLLDGLKKSYELNRLNMPLLNTDEVKIFEIGTVFSGDREEMHVAYINKKENKEMTVEEFAGAGFVDSEKGIFSGPRISSPEESPAELEVRPDHSKIPFSESAPDKFKTWSSYPFITRDIAVWVPNDTDKNVLVDIYKSESGGLLIGEPRLFDSFTKGDKTSYAYRLVFQSYDRTLTDEEVNIATEKINKKLIELNFEIR